jgi:hypothetical protein
VYIKNHGIPESQVFTFWKLHVEYWQWYFAQ